MVGEQFVIVLGEPKYMTTGRAIQEEEVLLKTCSNECLICKQTCSASDLHFMVSAADCARQDLT